VTGAELGGELVGEAELWYSRGGRGRRRCKCRAGLLLVSALSLIVVHGEGAESYAIRFYQFYVFPLFWLDWPLSDSMAKV
jgi:hypothetical protein